MRISYLILAHDNYLHLERLVNAIQGKDVRIYVHIDKRSAMPKNIEYPNVIFIKKRIAVYWAEFSIIEATLQLMKAALSDSFGEYYIYLSGTDYPIRSKSFLNEKLKEGGEFINILKGFHPSKPAKHYLHFHFRQIERKRFHPISMLFLLIERLIRLTGLTKKTPFQIYVGSQWFALSKKCAQYIINKVETDNTYFRYFRRTLVPDEAFFQTIIGNSPFADQTRNNLMFTDFGNKASPCIIQDFHVDQFKQEQNFTNMYGTYTPCFARKFSDDSEQVLKIIDRDLLNN